MVLTLLNHGWWKLNGIGLINLTKSKSNAPLQRRRKTVPPIPAVSMDNALRQKPSTFVFVNLISLDKSAIKKVSEIN